MSRSQEHCQQLLTSANYSDTDVEPKTRPNAFIRIFELSLYYAGLNRIVAPRRGIVADQNFPKFSN
jgi:hypothetical protein